MKQSFSSTLGIVLAILILGLVYVGVYIWPGGQPNSFLKREKTITAAHVESSTPGDRDQLPGVPVNVVIDVNLDLVTGSKISIRNNNIDYGDGDTTIDTNHLTLRRPVAAAAPDGHYLVSYKVCFSDGSCDDGQYNFSINRALTDGYVDMRGKDEVTINLQDTVFQPSKLMVTKGTTIIWRNDDHVGHYINTDAHPSHSYYPPQNSALLNPGDSYRFILDKPGIYPYHCSAHAATMIGSILVQDL